MNCVCKCGTEKLIKMAHLISGLTQSCGCLRDESSSSRTAHMRSFKDAHGFSNKAIYSVFMGMKQRCYNSNYWAYKDYGGRGIKICDRWLEDFRNFLEDMGEPPINYTIERKDNNAGYNKENCIWASRQDQQNNRRVNHLLTYKEKTMTVAQWGREMNMGHNTLSERLRKGWSVEEALETPVMRRKKV